MIFRNIKRTCSILMLGVFVTGCASTGETKSITPMLPVYTSKTVATQSRLVVRIARKVESANNENSHPLMQMNYGFDNAEKQLNEWAKTLNAEALVIISHREHSTNRKKTLVYGDAVRFIAPTFENISKELAKPSYKYESNSALYHAEKTPDPRYLEIMLPLLKSDKTSVSLWVKGRYAQYLVNHGQARYIKEYVYYVNKPDLCSSCVPVFGKALTQYGHAKYNPQYLTILKKGIDTTQIYGAQALATFGTKKYSAEWVTQKLKKRSRMNQIKM